METRTQLILREKPVFWGFLAVGFISLLGGIVMFFQVAREMKAEITVPTDVQVMFTTVFTTQNLLHNERGVYSPALSEMGVEAEMCRRYNCLLTLEEAGKNYKFRLEKDDRVWVTHAASPMPVEEK